MIDESFSTWKAPVPGLCSLHDLHELEHDDTKSVASDLNQLNERTKLVRGWYGQHMTE